MVNHAREAPHRRAEYRHFQRITTRWHDNDVYGHVNNVVFYSWFDTAVNEYLMIAGLLDPQSSPVIGLVSETHCRYFSTMAFPQQIDAGIRVARLGTTSVRYEIAIFGDAADVASAQGHFVHVYVDRTTRRPTPLPVELRETLERIHA